MEKHDAVRLFKGIDLEYLMLTEENTDHLHEPLEHILEIDYCRRGRLGWEMSGGTGVYLGQSDYSLHTMSTCADSVMTLPNGEYEGLRVRVDLRTLTDDPPELLAGSGITGELLRDKFCSGGSVSSFAGNEQTERLFGAFYERHGALELTYLRLKALELLLFLAELSPESQSRLTEYQAAQIEVIRRVHDHLAEHLSERFTIEELAHRYLMNPTTLKTLFKSVYGNSIAAHIKEHRMERASELLRSTELSVAEISALVGYDSQSRFAASFRDYSGKLPREYRNG